MSIGINVGASKDAVVGLQNAILAILKCDVENETKRVALQVLSKGCSADGAVVQNCTISMRDGTSGKKNNRKDVS